MAKNGFRFMDCDMHVFEPHDLYLQYMDPKWGDRVPRAEPRTGYGFHRFATADGKPVRKTRVPAELMVDNNAVNRQRDAQEAPRYRYGLEHGFDAASQVKAMDDEGIRPDALEAACTTTEAKALYCMPTLQNPTSAVMSEQRRKEIVSLRFFSSCE